MTINKLNNDETKLTHEEIILLKDIINNRHPRIEYYIAEFQQFNWLRKCTITSLMSKGYIKRVPYWERKLDLDTNENWVIRAYDEKILKGILFNIEFELLNK